MSLFVFSINPSFAQQRKLEVLTYDYKPFMYGDEDKPKGFLVDFFQIIAEEINQPYQLKFYPAVRAITEVHKDSSKLLLSSREAIPPEIQKDFIFIRLFEYIATLNGSKENVSKVKTFDDLKGKTLVFFRANEFAKRFSKKYKMKTLIVNSVDQEIKMLENSRADFNLCLIENCHTMTNSIKKPKFKYDFTTHTVLKTYAEIILRNNPDNLKLAQTIELAYRTPPVQAKLETLFSSFKAQYPTGVKWKHILEDENIFERLNFKLSPTSNVSTADSN